jgi:TatA/E family protein of Tat protein translocase
MPNIGFSELLLLGLVALVLFGPKRLPDMARSLGAGLRDFKESLSGEPTTPVADEVVGATPDESWTLGELVADEDERI